MKYKLFILLLIAWGLIGPVLGLKTVTQTWASGTTSSDTSPGQVRVMRSGDALQLTTGVNAGGTTSSSQDNDSTSGDGVTTTPDANNLASGSAQTASGSTILTNTQVQVPTGFADSIGQLINAILTAVMVIAALLVFLYLIWGGIQWITSGGDKGKTQDARNKIIAALIGLVIVAASFAILTLALQFLGFDDLNDVFDNTKNISAPGTSPSPTPTPSVSPSPTPSPIPTPSPTPSQ